MNVEKTKVMRILIFFYQQMHFYYELIAGTNLENIRLFYDLAQVSVVANIHCINLILNVPLKPLHFV